MASNTGKRINGYFNHYLHALEWRAERGLKYARQRLRRNTTPPRALFVVGCQRSGTNMLLNVLDKSPETWVYPEDNGSAFEQCRIKPVNVRNRLIDRARSQWVIFKPICDLQNLDKLLNDHPGSKAIWIYRQYQDVANSAIKRWGNGQKKLIRALATREIWKHWMAERLSAEDRNLIRNVYHDSMSDHSAAVLKWFLRSKWFFDLHLDRLSDRVFLVKYEDLVRYPEINFEAVFRFLDVPFSSSFVADIFETSVKKYEFPEIEQKIRDLSDELMKRLDAIYTRRKSHRSGLLLEDDGGLEVHGAI